VIIGGDVGFEEQKEIEQFFENTSSPNHHSGYKSTGECLQGLSDASSSGLDINRFSY
jgi:hypothetical protein